MCFDLKYYRNLLFSFAGLFLIAGWLNHFGSLNIGVILNWTITPSVSLTIMAVQINIHSNTKREKLFWILQTLFYLGLTINFLTINLILALTIFNALIGLLSILLILVAVVKTGKIERKEN